jgi:CRP-like cAMP-binding protein
VSAGPPPSVTGPSNRILDALPGVERDRLIRLMKVVALPITTVLFDPGEPIDAVHFPINCVVSLVTAFEGGSIVEVATIGNEGIVGVPHTAAGSLAVRAISLVPGASLRLDSAAFITASERPGPFRDLVHKYLQALFGQVSQSTACNRLHSNRKRLSRWLLMSHDRVGVDQFQIAHELVGQMLGSPRATATSSAGLLQAAGLIRYQRGQVAILNRKGLESVSCECYQVVKDALDRVMVPSPGLEPGRRSPSNGV